MENGSKVPNGIDDGNNTNPLAPTTDNKDTANDIGDYDLSPMLPVKRGRRPEAPHALDPTKPMMQRMMDGEKHLCGGPEMQAEMRRNEHWLHRFNQSLGLPLAQRELLLRERIGQLGEGALIKPPFHCVFAFNVHLEAGAFLNFNCVIVDLAPVHIGAHTLIGPSVQIYTSEHPRDPEERAAGWEWGRPVRIGRRCWIGGGAILLPGVSVGDNAIIGAGAVVTRDVAPNTTVAGSPARPI